MDPDDGRSRAAQLYDQVREAIEGGRLRPGDRLTPSRTVAAELRVSRATVTAAYTRLAAEGYIEGRSGRGSLVAARSTPERRAQQDGSLRPTARASAHRTYDSSPTVEARFDCRPGNIDAGLFPVRAWRRCYVRTLDRPPGGYDDPRGAEHLRAVLASWSGRSRGVRATAEQVVVSSGTGHAVDLVARVLLEPGDTVAVEDPGYPPVSTVLRSQGLAVHPVPVDAQGLVVDAIPSHARMVYVTPSHQFPLGMVMSRRRRLELLRWADRHDAAIIEDDYDTEFRHTAQPLEPLQLLDRHGRVIYVGTFSKSLSPALRVGFLVAPPALIPAMTAVRQAVDWCPPPAIQSALAHFIADGYFDQHLRKSRRHYTQRHRLMGEALDMVAPAGYRRLPAVAGLHVALLGPRDPDDGGVWQRLQARGLLASSLRRTYASGRGESGFLLGFASLGEREVGPAMRALGEVLTGPA